ncbi:xylose isomerase-like protein, partial [Pholiota molesta]
VGAHVSAAKGVENSIINAASIGANAFALFLKSQRKWTSPPLTESSIAEFKKRMEEHGYTSKMVLPHGSYLINLGNPDAEKREKSYVCFVDDLKRCQALGLELYNFHPGSTVGQATLEESLGLIAECINRAHKETQGVTAVVENMAGAGNIIGSDFSHLAGIIDRVEDKTRVGVCIDTCHAFAAGYDIRTKEGWDHSLVKSFTVKVFDEKVGLQYLRGMHLNDSKTECNSNKDRHENIGLGHLGLEAFRHVLSDPRTQGLPLILETPSFEQPREVWGKEIEILQRISG